MHQRGGGARLFESFGNDQRDRLMVVLNVGPTEQTGNIVFAFGELAGIFRGDDRQYAGRRLGFFQIDGRDSSFGNGGGDHIAIGLIGDDVVPLIRIRGGARGLERTVNAVGLPDQLP